MYKPFRQMVGFSGTETFVGCVTKWLKSFGLLTATLEIKSTYQKKHITFGIFSAFQHSSFTRDELSALFLK